MRRPQEWQDESRRQVMNRLYRRWRAQRRARRLAAAAVAVADCTAAVRAAVARWNGEAYSLPGLLAALVPHLQRRLAAAGCAVPELVVTAADLAVDGAAQRARESLRDEGQRTLLLLAAVHKLAGLACGGLLRGMPPALAVAADLAGWEPGDTLLRALGLDGQAEMDRVAALLAAGRAGWRACRRRRLERALLAQVVAAAYALPLRRAATRRLRCCRAGVAAEICA